MAIKHAHTAVTADDPGADVQPSHWNADHTGTNAHTHQSATEGGDLRATSAQVAAGTSEAVFATPKALKDAGFGAVAGIDGWTTVTDTWLYASATTITVPAGALSIYQPGDVWKLTANSVVLEGYVSVVSNTLLTVVGDPLTNYTFSNIKFSHMGVPLGLSKGPFALITRDAVQSIANDTLAVVTMDHIYYDTGNFYAAGDPTKITFPFTGFYYLDIEGDFAANTTGVREIYIYISGVQSYQFRLPAVAASSIEDKTYLPMQRGMFRTAGEYAEFKVVQTSGGALDLAFFRASIYLLSPIT